MVRTTTINTLYIDDNDKFRQLKFLRGMLQTGIYATDQERHRLLNGLFTPATRTRQDSFSCPCRRRKQVIRLTIVTSTYFTCSYISVNNRQRGFCFRVVLLSVCLSVNTFFQRDVSLHAGGFQRILPLVRFAADCCGSFLLYVLSVFF